MTRWIRALPALAIVGMGLAGWILPGESRAGETKKLTAEDNRRREPLRLARDDTVEVRLTEQRGTGYAWRKAPESTKSLELVGEPVAEQGELPGKPGLVEYRLFRFRVPKPPLAKEGKHELKLIYTRPGSDRAAKTFTVPIEVK
jgi:predicted secreted protein